MIQEKEHRLLVFVVLQREKPTVTLITQPSILFEMLCISQRVQLCLYTNTPVLPNSAILGQFFVCYDIANLVCMAWYQRPFDFYVFYGYSSVCLSVRPPIHLADIYDVYEYTCFSSYLSVRPSARLTISSFVCLSSLLYEHFNVFSSFLFVCLLAYNLYAAPDWRNSARQIVLRWERRLVTSGRMRWSEGLSSRKSVSVNHLMDTFVQSLYNSLHSRSVYLFAGQKVKEVQEHNCRHHHITIVIHVYLPFCLHSDDIRLVY